MDEHVYQFRSSVRLEWVVLASSLLAGASFLRADPKPEPGLAVAYTTRHGDPSLSTDFTILPNAALYIPAGQPPTPFLPSGRFSAEWNGFVSVELRDTFTFQADLNGDLALEINGALVLQASAKGTNTEPSKTVRLNKGTNALKLRFESPPAGDALVRLYWSSREFPMEPISPAVLSHEVTPELRKADRLRRGRELFVEFRCAKCHAVPAGDAAMPELSMDAPSFEGIGSRRNESWMARWIADPRSLRPAARMPALFHGMKAKADAESTAAFLASLKSPSLPPVVKEPAPGQIESGKKLFETLHCVACHDDPSSTTIAPTRISLRQVAEKFPTGRLEEFLQKPDAHYTWIRMPDFKLSAAEAAQLAAFLNSVSDQPGDIPAPGEVAALERGKKLVQTSGCLNCHSLKLENQFSARALADLSSDRWRQGCLAERPGDAPHAPQFGFVPGEREALRAFAETDRASLSWHVSTEFAERQTRLLNCRECHGKFEGFPPLEILGGKLRPEWSKAFISGAVPTRPRFWLEARMPAFPRPAEALAHGIAALHGYPPQTPAEPPIDEAAARIGQKLVAAPPDGFACVQCHAVAAVGATQVFESNGINLALTGERLLKPYYLRWLRNPLRIDPATKMPVYFDEQGRSPLADVYEGDGAKQMNAIWQYLRLGMDMPPPPGTRPPP